MIFKFMIYFWNLFQLFHYTPLICASENGFTKIVELLLSKSNIDVNCKNIFSIQKFYEIQNHFYFHEI